MHVRRWFRESLKATNGIGATCAIKAFVRNCNANSKPSAYCWAATIAAMVLPHRKLTQSADPNQGGAKCQRRVALRSPPPLGCVGRKPGPQAGTRFKITQPILLALL